MNTRITTQERTIVITGCSRGIGLALANTFLASNQYHVVGTSTTGDSTIEHPNFSCYALSLENKESISTLTSTLKNKHKEIHGLINNAAILLEDWDDATINIDMLETTLAVNLVGLIRLTEDILSFSDNISHIINMSSNWGSFSDPSFSAYQPHYKISKASLNMYSKLLAKRLAQQNITVSAFDPGWVKTDMGGANASTLPTDVAATIFDLFHANPPSGCFWRGNKKREW